ncbi:MAG: hypothetical protein JO108_10695 [Acidobacteriaceae bacterium]|nr:hypothetical protein [Acidobacteriaceae bacterium]
MQKQLDPITLMAALLVALWGLTLLTGPYAAFTGFAGLALLILLFSFDQEGYRSGLQSLGFAFVCAFCATDIAAYLSRFFSTGEAPAANEHFGHQGLALFLASVTLICWAIDRARMSARQPAAAPVSFRETQVSPRFAVPAPAPLSRPEPAPVFAPQATAASAPVSYAPPPVAPAPAAPPPPAPMPAAAPEPSHAYPSPSFNTQPPAPPPTYAPPPPAYAPPPQPPPVPRGKETSIYVTLVGEGLNLMRAVRAEHLGQDYYRIVDVMPEGETWQYQPGQVVRARKKNLSSGKALVAFEEAPRSA